MVEHHSHDPALTSIDLRVSFGAFVAVRDVSAVFRPGRRYALIGPNGAGKTTFLNALSGRQRASSGRVLLGERDITRLPAHQRLSAGMGRSFQIVNIFTELSVFENLCLAVQGAVYGSRQPWARRASGDARVMNAAYELAKQTGLEGFREVAASKLSHGDQRALELALALASNPSVLLLDEPLAGVGHGQVDQTMALIKRLSEGRTVLLVEHNMDAVMSFADEILVLDGGALLARGTPSEIRANASVRKAYLGE